SSSSDHRLQRSSGIDQQQPADCSDASARRQPSKKRSSSEPSVVAMFDADDAMDKQEVADARKQLSTSKQQSMSR
ncbi:hypothetical protein Dimus_013380, partial [Dionaea muscipula]